jgi:hypothetical protein
MTAPTSHCSTNQAFALMLEIACEDFENLQNLISGHAQSSWFASPKSVFLMTAFKRAAVSLSFARSQRTVWR